MALKALEKLREFISDQFVENGKTWLEGAEIVNEIEAEIAERFCELPLDADGMPIHVGDVLENNYVVDYVSSHWVFAIGRGAKHAGSCHHVKQRTLEDVLNEFGIAAARELNADPDGYGISDKTIAKCVSEIHELIGGDAS